MDETPSANTQTDRFLFWAAFLILVAAAFMLYSSIKEEEEKLAGLHKIEKGREAELALAEKARDQGTRFLDRFSGDPEFVRDQARERLGLASQDEVVIRVEGTSATSTPGGRPSPSLFAPAPSTESAR
jgi:hypothetical protein